MRILFTLFCLIIFNASFSQVDTLRISKKEEGTTLFSSIEGQAVKAMISISKVSELRRIEVNDTIKVASYWFTCYSNGTHHQREETGDILYGEIIREISKLPIGGKAYFTEIKGYNIYTHDPYDIYDLVVEIKK